MNWSLLARKKKYNAQNIHETNLSRVLGLIDITALGVSCTLGNGIYVLAGEVIANYAGPSIVISFIIAGLATFIAAEFGARVPRSGSAYVYIYVTIGEFIAFILGWDLILEYVIGVSSGASSLSRYIDAMFGKKIEKALENAMPLNIEGIASYPDFLSFSLVILITIFMVVGVKESTLLNKIFTLLNIIVILFIFVCGILKADFINWNIKPNSNLSWIDHNSLNQTCDSSNRCGKGGYTPFGFSGIIQGAAKCFYAFIGFDAIASTGEEVLNPKRNIPLSIVFTLLIVSICYCSVSFVLTLMIPYYIIDPEVPIPQAFDYVGLEWARILVSIGAIASLITCLYASMFPMPRIIYSLASDGLIFKPLSYVMPKLKTPVFASIFSGLFAGILCLIFDLNQLIDMMSIGTLMAYSVVALCIIILRYRAPENSLNSQRSDMESNIYQKILGYSNETLIKRMFFPSEKKCSLNTSKIVNFLTAIATLIIIILSIILSWINEINKTYGYVIVSVFLLLALLIISLSISKQPQDDTIESFKVPFVPLLPFLSVIINTYLMMALSWHTWLRFGIWFLIGIVVYFLYGIRNSSATIKQKENNEKYPPSFK